MNEWVCSNGLPHVGSWNVTRWVSVEVFEVYGVVTGITGITRGMAEPRCGQGCGACSFRT